MMTANDIHPDDLQHLSELPKKLAKRRPLARCSTMTVDLETVSIRCGGGNPRPAVNPSERQYEGFLRDWL